MAVVFCKPHVASHLVTAVPVHSGSRTIPTLILPWLGRSLETIRWFQELVGGQVNPSFSLLFEESFEDIEEVRLLPVCGGCLYAPSSGTGIASAGCFCVSAVTERV